MVLWFQEWVELLREMVLKLPEVANLGSLKPLRDENLEIDFFKNILHIQVKFCIISPRGLYVHVVNWFPKEKKFTCEEFLTCNCNTLLTNQFLINLEKLSVLNKRVEFDLT